MFKFLVKNVRRGFATNSSSSHSFVYMKRANYKKGVAPVGENFGWQDFRLDTLMEKLYYVLVSKMTSHYSWDESDEAKSSRVDQAMKLYGKDVPEFDREVFEAASNSYVDHESVGLIDFEQARDPFLVVFGGNDNDGESQERAEAIRRGEVDWGYTPVSYGDADLIPKSDEKGQRALEGYYKDFPWARP